MNRRTVVTSIIAALSLGSAGYAAANGRLPGEHGRPSVTPPPWSHGGGHHKGEGHGKSGEDHGKTADHGKHHGRD